MMAQEAARGPVAEEAPGIFQKPRTLGGPQADRDPLCASGRGHRTSQFSSISFLPQGEERGGKKITVQNVHFVKSSWIENQKILAVFMTWPTCFCGSISEKIQIKEPRLLFSVRTVRLGRWSVRFLPEVS